LGDENGGKILKIKRYRLNYQGLDIQQERTWSKGGINIYKDKGQYKTNLGILNRGIMLNPNLYLALKMKKMLLKHLHKPFVFVEMKIWYFLLNY
jgi:hypothetical protein